MILSAKRDVDVARKLSSRRSISSEMPRCSALNATERYIAPVSSLEKPNLVATSRAMVDLPEPAGPVNGDDHVILL